MTCHNQPATTGAAQTSLARPAFRGGTHLHTQPAGPSDPSALRPVHRGSHEIPVTSLQQTPRTPGSDPRTFRQDTRPRGPDKQLHPAGAQAAPHPGCPGTRTGPAGWPLAPLSASRPTGATVTSADVPKPALPRLLGTPRFAHSSAHPHNPSPMQVEPCAKNHRFGPTTPRRWPPAPARREPPAPPAANRGTLRLQSSHGESGGPPRSTFARRVTQPGRTPFCKLNTNPGGPSATNKYQGNQRR